MKLTRNFNKNYLRDWNLLSTRYSFNKGNENGQIATLNRCRNTTKIIKYFFSPITVLSSRPVFLFTNEEVVINLFYYRPKNMALNNNSINNLGELLGKIFKRRVKLEFVKLYYPHLNSNILAEYLRLNTSNKGFRKLKKTFFKKKVIIKNPNSSKALNLKLPSHIVGMKIQISGRLVTEPVRPRKTVSKVQVGPIRSDNKTILVDYGSYTGKNAHGAYTVKVSIRQQLQK